MVVSDWAPDTRPRQHGRTAAWQRGWPFRGRIWSPSPSQAALSLGTRRGRGTQVPAHPNNVRPLARSGQCLASPAQSPAGSPPHSPQAPLNFGRGRSIVVGTLAPCPSPPPPAVEGRYREPGMGGQRHGPDLHFNQVQVRSWGPKPASPQQVSVPVLRAPKDPTKQGPILQCPSLQPVSKSPGQGAKQAGELACVPVCVRVRVPVVVVEEEEECARRIVVTSLCVCE